MIRLSRVHFPVTALGPGMRLGIWVQGCHLACPGCMSRDTWSADGGSLQPVETIVAAWLGAVREGATGVTISGGEPAEQAGQVAELIRAIKAADAAPADVLVFSGLDEEQFRASCPALVATADAAIVGPFDITKPTRLVWRGSANQRLLTFTALGAERLGPYRAVATDSPAMQFVVNNGRICTIGIPRIGDLPALERRLREHGLAMGRVSWRP